MQLFERQGKKLILNDNGKKLLKHCKSILSELNDLKDSFNSSMNKSVSLYVNAASSLMPEILEKFKELYPSIKISIYQSKKTALIMIYIFTV